MRLVIVTWEDIVVGNGWTSYADVVATNPDLAKTVGWIAHEDDKKLVLVHGTSNEIHNPYTVIPQGVILSVKDISE